MQSSQRQTFSPSNNELHEPILETESNESVLNNRPAIELPSAEAASIFFAKSISISDFGRCDGDDELWNVILSIWIFFFVILILKRGKNIIFTTRTSISSAITEIERDTEWNQRISLLKLDITEMNK